MVWIIDVKQKNTLGSELLFSIPYNGSTSSSAMNYTGNTVCGVCAGVFCFLFLVLSYISAVGAPSSINNPTMRGVAKFASCLVRSKIPRAAHSTRRTRHSLVFRPSPEVSLDVGRVQREEIRPVLHYGFEQLQDLYLLRICIRM